MVKLTESDITEIRKLYADGMEMKDISKKYDVSVATIRNAISNKKYRGII